MKLLQRVLPASLRDLSSPRQGRERPRPVPQGHLTASCVKEFKARNHQIRHLNASEEWKGFPPPWPVFQHCHLPPTAMSELAGLCVPSSLLEEATQNAPHFSPVPYKPHGSCAPQTLLQEQQLAARLRAGKGEKDTKSEENSRDQGTGLSCRAEILPGLSGRGPETTCHLRKSSGTPKYQRPKPPWALPVSIHHNSRKPQMAVVAGWGSFSPSASET